MTKTQAKLKAYYVLQPFSVYLKQDKLYEKIKTVCV